MIDQERARAAVDEIEREAVLVTVHGGTIEDGDELPMYAVKVIAAALAAARMDERRLVAAYLRSMNASRTALAIERGEHAE